MMKLRANRGLLPVLGILAAALLWAVIFYFVQSLEKENAGLKARQAELALLKEEFLALQTAVNAVEGKKSLTKVEGIVQATDDILGSLGLSGKVKSLKTSGTREKNFGMEEDAELQVEKVSMNEMANIFYKIENAPMILAIKRTAIKTSFEDPSLLNISMTISLIKPK